MTRAINEPVEVLVAYKNGGRKAIPKIMSWKNRLYTFTKFGFLHPDSRGRKMIHVFTMSNEAMTFRLEFDAESLNWTLREITDGLPS